MRHDTRDVLENLSRNCRNNLMINNLLIEKHHREYEFREREGFVSPLLLVISLSMRCSMNRYGCYAGDYRKDFGFSTELVDRVWAEKWKGADIITPCGKGRFTPNGQASRGGKKYAHAD